MEILQIRLLMSNPAVSDCLLLSGWKIGTITCKHGGNGWGARQADHREMQVSNKDPIITPTVTRVLLKQSLCLMERKYHLHKDRLTKKRLFKL